MEGSKIWVIFVVLVVASSIWASDESSDESNLEEETMLRNFVPREPQGTPEETGLDVRCSSHGCHTSCTNMHCPLGEVCVIVGGQPKCRDKAALVVLLCGLKKCLLGLQCVVQVAVLSIGLFVAICIPVGGSGETCADLTCLVGFICVMHGDTGSCIKKSSHESSLCSKLTCASDKHCRIQLSLELLGIWVAICIGGTGVISNPQSCMNVICPDDCLCILDGGFVSCHKRALLEVSLCALQNCQSSSLCVIQVSFVGICVAICIGCVGPDCPSTCANVCCPPCCICMLDDGKPTCVKKTELEIKLCSEIKCHGSCCIQEKSLGVWVPICNHIPPHSCSSLTCNHGHVCIIENGVPCCQDKTHVQIRLCLDLKCPHLHICLIFESSGGTGIWHPRCIPHDGDDCPDPCASLICAKHHVCVVHTSGHATCEDRGIHQTKLCSRHHCPIRTQCNIECGGKGKWTPVCAPCLDEHCGATCASVTCPLGKVCVISNGKASCEKRTDISLFLCARKRCRRGQRCIVKEKPGPRGFWIAICINIRPPPCPLSCGLGYICRRRPIKCRRPPCRLVPTCVVDPTYDPCKHCRPCPNGFKCVSVPDKNCKAHKDQRGLVLDDFEDDENHENENFSDNGDFDENGEHDNCDFGCSDDLGDDSEQETNLELGGRYQGQGDDGNLTGPLETSDDFKPTGLDCDEVQTHRHRIEGCPPVAECQRIHNHDPCDDTTCPKDHYCVTIPDVRCEKGCGSQESCSEEKCLEEILTKSKRKICPRIAKCIPKIICQSNPCKLMKCKKGHRCQVRKRECEEDDENCCQYHGVCVRSSG